LENVRSQPHSSSTLESILYINIQRNLTTDCRPQLGFLIDRKPQISWCFGDQISSLYKTCYSSIRELRCIICKAKVK